MARDPKKRRPPESASNLKAGTRDRRWRWSGALALIAAGLWIYWPALTGAFLWDDVETVTSNPHLRDLGGLAGIWFVAPLPDWPLTSTLLWVLWHLFGNQPLGYHLCSLALHLGSGFLIWRVLGRLGLRWGWLGGLLFVIHPLAVESVAWISEIKNTLSLPLFLLAFDAWLDADEGKASGYGRSLLFYLAAMWAKTSTVALPLALLLYCWWKRGTVTRRETVRLVPFFLISLVLGLVSVYFQGNKVEDAAIQMGSLTTRLIQAASAVFFYLGRFLLPVGFLPVYPRPSFSPPTLLELLAVPALLTILAVLWTQRRGWGRHVLFGLGFFLLNLAPVLGLVRMEFMTISWVSDHFAYLAMIGLVALVVAGWECAQTRVPMAIRKAGMAAGLVVLAFLAWESRQVASVFINAQTLWAYTVEHNPQAYVAYNNLAGISLAQGRVFEAINLFERALRLNPNYAEAHQNLGTALLKINRPAEAAVQYQLALKANPHYANAHNGLGVVLMQSGRYPEAVVEYQEALKIDPTLANAHHNLATTLLQLNRVPEAIAQEQLALKYYPGFPQARDGLARAQAALAGVPADK